LALVPLPAPHHDYRVGIDLVDAAEVAAALEAHGDRYLRRVYTPEEVQDCRRDAGIDAERLAARFAAKEAAIKVLRPDRRTAVPWTGIAVRRDPAGWVGLELHGRAAALAEAAGITRTALSISHERGTSCAVVLAHIELPSGGRRTT
jgi:holo-[acyl-carrier protein] synthase